MEQVIEHGNQHYNMNEFECYTYTIQYTINDYNTNMN